MTAFTELFTKHIETLSDNGTTQAMIANELEISQSFLSEIKLGTRYITPDLLDSFIDIYKLSEREALKLHRAAAQDRGYKV